MINRKNMLQDLVEFRKHPTEMHAALTTFEWDSDVELIQLERQHITAVLEKYILGEFTSEEIEDWASLVECRDDVNYAEVAEILHILANPAITYQLTPSVAAHLVDKLKTSNTPLEPSR